MLQRMVKSFLYEPFSLKKLLAKNLNNSVIHHSDHPLMDWDAAVLPHLQR